MRRRSQPTGGGLPQGHDSDQGRLDRLGGCHHDGHRLGLLPRDDGFGVVNCRELAHADLLVMLRECGRAGWLFRYSVPARTSGRAARGLRRLSVVAVLLRQLPRTETLPVGCLHASNPTLETVRRGAGGQPFNVGLVLLPPLSLGFPPGIVLGRTGLRLTRCRRLRQGWPGARTADMGCHIEGLDQGWYGRRVVGRGIFRVGGAGVDLRRRLSRTTTGRGPIPAPNRPIVWVPAAPISSSCPVLDARRTTP